MAQYISLVFSRPQACTS